MTGERSIFSELDTGVHGTVRFGDSSVVAIEGRGTILFRLRSGEHQEVARVLLHPEADGEHRQPQPARRGRVHDSHQARVLRIWNRRRRLLAKVQRSPNRLYILTLAIDRPVCLAARSSEVAWQWHAWFGHLRFEGLKELSKVQMVRGRPLIDHVEQVYDSCLAGKQRRQPFPAASKFCATRLLELVHADLCGPITPETPGGKKLFLLAVNDQSRYMWLVLLSSKDQAGDVIIRLQVRVEAEAG